MKTKDTRDPPSAVVAELGPVTTWERVDERVLRWVSSLPPSQATNKIWDFRDTSDGDRPFEDIAPGEVDAALHRLQGFGLVAGQSDPGMRLWWRLRVAPRGLVYLGEWPDPALATSSETLRTVLRAIADQAPEDERSALVRAAGLIGRTLDGVLRDTVSDAARDLGAELG